MDQVVARSASAAQSANPLLSAPILPTLLRLTAPNLAAMLVTALVAIFETIYVGILGTTQLAAIALVFPLIMLMQMLSAGAMGGGVSSAISRALGAGDSERAAALAVHALAIGVMAGLGFSLLFGLFGRPILSTLGGSGPVLDQAVLYASVGLTGAIVIWLLNTLASIVRGTGNMRVPSLTLLAASAVQIVLGGTLGLGLGPFPRFGLDRRRVRVRCRLHPRGRLPAVVPSFRKGPHNADVRRQAQWCDVLRHPEGRRGGGVLAAAGRPDGADPDEAGGELRHRGPGRVWHRRPPRVPAGAHRVRRRCRQRTDGGDGNRRRQDCTRAPGRVDGGRRCYRSGGG